MKSILIVMFVFLALSLVNAHQLLNKGYFIYNNVTVGNAGQIVMGVNASANIDVFVVRGSDFSAFIQGKSYYTLYNSTAVSGIHQLNVDPGNYTVVFEALGSTRLEAHAISAPRSAGRQFVLNGQYIYNLTTANYSNIYVTVLAAGDYSVNPLSVNISGIGGRATVDSNLYRTNESENRGANNVVISDQMPMNVFVLINSTSELVNPLNGTTPQGNYSVGVASYGIYNISGRLYPYQVRTDEVVGVANISAISAYNPNPAANTSVSGASMQLNVVLNTYVGNKLKVFWLQDVVDFNTSSGEYYLIDNIWNNTGISSNVSKYDLVGSGNLTNCGACGNQTFYADTYPGLFFNYTLPLSMKLIILQNQTPGGSEISFGYQILRNGSVGLQPLVFYDHILIPGSGNSTILTTPYYETPSNGGLLGNFYDSEFVFGGESSGVNTNFYAMNASVWIFYDRNGQLVPFPSVYTFGQNTAESATNLKTGPGKSGAVVTTGQLNLAENLVTSNTLNSTGNYLANTSQYGAPSTTTVGFVQQQTNKISKAEIYAVIVIAGISVIFILIIGFVLLRRK